MTLAYEPDDTCGIPVPRPTKPPFAIELNCPNCASSKAEANAFRDAECYACGHRWKMKTRECHGVRELLKPTNRRTRT